MRARQANDRGHHRGIQVNREKGPPVDIDLSVLRLMEREREIPFEELVQIIEQAILTAYLKHIGQADDADKATAVDARVHLDRKTGHVSVFVPELDEVPLELLDVCTVGHSRTEPAPERHCPVEQADPLCVHDVERAAADDDRAFRGKPRDGARGGRSK